MDTDNIDPTSSNPIEPDADPTPPDYPRTLGDAGTATNSETPVTATGERSETVEQDEDGGVLPVPEPTEGGAPAP